MNTFDVRFWWNYLKFLPFGNTLFSFFLGLVVPYTGSLRAKVLTIDSYTDESHVRVQMKDHWFLRNHIRCFHAAALANLMELTGSLALLSVMPGDMACIITTVTCSYLKKARGTLVAECVGDSPIEGPHQCRVYIKNSRGELVAEGKCFFQVKLKKPRGWFFNSEREERPDVIDRPW